MSQIQTQYGTSNQVITITLASLASGSSRQSAVVDNTANLFLDVLFQLVLKTGAASVVATGYVNIWVYGTTDNGTTYGDGATGSDAAFTATVPSNLRLLGSMNTVANATTYKSNPMSVAAAFGGVLPQKWGIVVENQSGGAFDATGGNFDPQYQGVYGQTV